jgi:hypothetical protein
MKINNKIITVEPLFKNYKKNNTFEECRLLGCGAV